MLFAYIALAGTLAALAGMGACFVFLLTDATPPVDANPTGFWTVAVVGLFVANIAWNWLCVFTDRLLDKAAPRSKSL